MTERVDPLCFAKLEQMLQLLNYFNHRQRWMWSLCQAAMFHNSHHAYHFSARSPASQSVSVSVVLRLAYPHQHPIRSFLFSLPRLSKYADSFNFLLAADQTESARRAEDGVRGVGRARLSKYEPLVFSQDISALKQCLSLNAERRLILAS